MISVRCPACGKVVGFEESDAGSLVACPHCRQTFFVPVMAQPLDPADAAAPPAAAAPPVGTKLPIEPTLPDLDDLRIAADPDLDPAPEQIDEVEVADEPPPPPPPIELPPEPAPLPPDPIPYLELDPPRPEPIETVEPVGVPKEVEPTDLAPSLSAAEVLSQSLPEPEKPNRPTDVLEEVEDEKGRFKDREDDGEDVEVAEVVEEEEERPRRKPKRRKTEHRTPVGEQKSLPEGVTRNRILGGVGAGMGGMILLGTVAHHLTALQNAWHPGVCCADIFALALIGVGIFYLIRG